MKRYTRIDVCRLLCAFLVVMIHCVEVFEGHEIAHMIVNCFAQQAVPFFFIASGFFFAKKFDASEEKIKVIRSFVLHNLLLYMAWMVVELPELIRHYHIQYPNSSVFSHALHIFRRVVFVGWDVYWYLLVLAEAALVTGLLLYWKKEKWLYFLAGTGLLVGFAFNANIKMQPFGLMNDVLFLLFSWNNNIVMEGLPYMAIGVWFAHHERNIKISERYPIVGYIAVSAASVSLFWINQIYGINWVRFVHLTAIQATLLFLIALYPSKYAGAGKWISNCRDLSSCIYFVHNIAIQYIANVFWPIDSPTLFRFLIGVVPGVLVWLVVRNSKCKPVKWMLSIK